MQSYVSNGLRAVGRLAVAGAAVLAMAVPVYSQAKFREGMYVTPDGKNDCFVSKDKDQSGQVVSCSIKAEDDKVTSRTLHNDELIGITYHFPDGRMETFDIVSAEGYKVLKNLMRPNWRYVIKDSKLYTDELSAAKRSAEATIRPENDELANLEKMHSRMLEEMKKGEEMRKKDAELFEKLKAIMDAQKKKHGE